MTDERAFEVSLDEDSQDSFLRLARALPSLLQDIAALAKSLESVDLAVSPFPTGVHPAITFEEAIRDLRAVAKSVPAEERARFEKAASDLGAFTAWHGHPSNLEVPQDATKKESVGVFLRVPPRIAKDFPNKDEDQSPPHATLLWAGDCTRDEFHKVIGCVREVAKDVEPFRVDMADYGEFESHEGRIIPHMIPKTSGNTLEALHKGIKFKVEETLDRAVGHESGFRGHITLGYLSKGQKYDGPKPTGKWKADSVEVWGAHGGEFGRSVIGLGSGNVIGHVDSTKADVLTSDLASSGGALAPAQGSGKKPKKKEGEIGGEPGKMYPQDYLELPYYTAQAAPMADVEMRDDEIEKSGWTDEARAAALEARRANSETRIGHVLDFVWSGPRGSRGVKGENLWHLGGSPKGRRDTTHSEVRFKGPEAGKNVAERLDRVGFRDMGTHYQHPDGTRAYHLGDHVTFQHTHDNLSPTDAVHRQVFEHEQNPRTAGYRSGPVEQLRGTAVGPKAAKELVDRGHATHGISDKGQPLKGSVRLTQEGRAHAATLPPSPGRTPEGGHISELPPIDNLRYGGGDAGSRTTHKAEDGSGTSLGLALATKDPDDDLGDEAPDDDLGDEAPDVPDGRVAEKAGAPFPKKKPDGKHLFANGEDVGPGEGSTGSSTGASGGTGGASGAGMSAPLPPTVGKAWSDEAREAAAAARAAHAHLSSLPEAPEGYRHFDGFLKPGEVSPSQVRMKDIGFKGIGAGFGLPANADKLAQAQELDPANVHYAQSSVVREAVGRKVSGENTTFGGAKSELPLVVKLGSEYHLQDGNHRAAADVLQTGKLHARVIEAVKSPKGKISWKSPGEVKKADLEVPQDETAEQALEMAKNSLQVDLLKRDGEERTVLGIVLEPETEDSQHDIYSAEEIEQTAWKWAERYQHIGLMHRTLVPGVVLLETYLAPCDFPVSALQRDGNQTDLPARKIKKGTWLLRARVVDDTLWNKIQNGELRGWSIGGSAVRRKITN